MEFLAELLGGLVRRLLPERARRVIDAIGLLTVIALIVFIVFFTPVVELIARNFRRGRICLPKPSFAWLTAP